MFNTSAVLKTHLKEFSGNPYNSMQDCIRSLSVVLVIVITNLHKLKIPIICIWRSTEDTIK